MLSNVLRTFALLFFIFHKASTIFDDCMKNHGKEIVLGVCVPNRYDKMVPPNLSPITVQIDFRISGVKAGMNIFQYSINLIAE